MAKAMNTAMGTPITMLKWTLSLILSSLQKAIGTRLDQFSMVGMLTPASLVWPLASVASK